MAECHSGKVPHTGQTGRIPDFLTAMVAGSYNIQEASRNLSYLQEQTYHSSKTTNSVLSCHHGHHHKMGYHSSDYFTNPHYHSHTTPRPDDWAMYHSYSALSQCLPVESSQHHDHFLTTYHPVSEMSDTKYDRCSTPDIIQSMLQMETHDVSPIGRQTENQVHNSTTTTATSPSSTVLSPPQSSIWRSPGGREYMDSGYLSEDSLSNSAFLSKCTNSNQDHSAKIPGFAPSFFKSTTSSLKTPSEFNKHNTIKSFSKSCRDSTKHQSIPSKTTCSSTTPVSSPTSSNPKYESISPVQVSCISSEFSPLHIRQTLSSTDVSPINIQSSQVSTSGEKVPLMTAEVKTHGHSLKRKLSDTDLQTEKSSTDTKRGRHNEPLNQRAIMIMTSWYNSHKDNPYPSKDEKQKMAVEGGIRVSQVKSWFANKRNRSNNTRPKVQKQQLQDRLLTLCHSLAKDQQPVMDNSFIIQQLSTLITSAQR